MKPDKSKMVYGSVESIDAGVIKGWLGALSEELTPVLLVNGRTAQVSAWPIDRPDVVETTGLSKATGFEFTIEDYPAGASIQLFGMEKDTLHILDEKKSDHAKLSTDVFNRIVEAKRIAEKPGSVAVTCWDGGHNPIGRAKVLYDVSATRRPTVIFAFLFDEFSGKLWAPLQTTDFHYVAIPWAQRDLYLDMIEKLEIVFDTVWVCKNRLPSLSLAGHLSGPETRVVLDHDDNEAHFSESKNAREKFYGRFTTSLAKHLTRQIKGHTAASITLAEETGAEIVRHARPSMSQPRPTKTDGQVYNIGFIGTVRPHKGMREALAAVQVFNWQRDKNVKLHVYGNFDPKSLRDELKEKGAEVKENIDNANLYNELASFDVILTGFSDDNTNEEVTRYQISSKIGDALSVGRPALVPYSASVADLKDVPGVFIFTLDTFFDQLEAAMAYTAPVSLPEPFTLEGAYEGFEAAERKAMPCEMQSMLDVVSPSPVRTVIKQTARTLVLMWKQSDAGLYGRRIDQIARTYKAMYPEDRVVILEVIHQVNHDSFEANENNFVDDDRIQRAYAIRKECQALDELDGIEYHMLRNKRRADADAVLQAFLIRQNILPNNSLFIMFPVVPFFEESEHIFDEYHCIVDVVDNQFSWASKKTRQLYSAQYAKMLRTADHVVFNSANNRDFFQSGNFLPAHSNSQGIEVIPNWYVPPIGLSSKQVSVPEAKSDRLRLIYSGNMNDRFDWTLLAELSQRVDDIDIYLVGAAQRQLEQLENLLSTTNVTYWGILPEHKLIKLLAQCDVGIVPHTVDKVSSFMNPLKIEMYRQMRLPVVTVDLPGIASGDDVHVCPDRDSFIAKIAELKETRPAKSELSTIAYPDNARKYVHLIQKVFKTVQH